MALEGILIVHSSGRPVPGTCTRHNVPCSWPHAFLPWHACQASAAQTSAPSQATPSDYTLMQHPAPSDLWQHPQAPPPGISATLTLPDRRVALARCHARLRKTWPHPCDEVPTRCQVLLVPSRRRVWCGRSPYPASGTIAPRADETRSSCRGRHRLHATRGSRWGEEVRR